MEVPNKKKIVSYYTVQYDKTKLVESIDIDDCCCRFPSIQPVKELLKRAIVRINIIGYRFKGNMNQRKKQSEKSTPTTTVSENTTTEKVVADDRVDKQGSVLLAGILTISKPKSAARNDENDSSSEESECDEGSVCDMETSTF